MKDDKQFFNIFVSQKVYGGMDVKDEDLLRKISHKMVLPAELKPVLKKPRGGSVQSWSEIFCMKGRVGLLLLEVPNNLEHHLLILVLDLVRPTKVESS